MPGGEMTCQVARLLKLFTARSVPVVYIPEDFHICRLEALEAAAGLSGI